MRVLAGCLWIGLLPAQRLSVYSEFVHAKPAREIISPAAARNAYASFHVVVEAPPGQTYTLYMAQNPEDTLGYHVYEERAGDELLPVAMPHTAQGAQMYLLDLWVPPDAPPGRIRFEAQLNAGERWIIYPLEVRIQEVVTKAPGGFPLKMPAAGERADQAAAAAARVAVCKQGTTPAPEPIRNLCQIVARNALRDLTLAGSSEDLASLVTRASGYESTDAFCRATAPAPNGPEWWLRLRDHFYQGKRLP